MKQTENGIGNPRSAIESALVGHFGDPHGKTLALVRHFGDVIREFHRQAWEESIQSGGQFVEALLKMLGYHAGVTVQTGKDFKVGNLIDDLARANKGAADDSVRLLMPRACRVIYEIASNRGARHDADGIDANFMDAAFVQSAASWLMAELIRLSDGSLDLARSRQLVRELSLRRLPAFEAIEGRIYINVRQQNGQPLGARDAAVLLLYSTRPGRTKKANLVEGLKLQSFRPDNIRKAVNRLDPFVDESSEGILLRASGVAHAEALLAADPVELAGE